MKYNYASLVLGISILLGTQTTLAQDDETERVAEERRAYEVALEQARQEQQAAHEAIERARMEMDNLAEEQGRATEVRRAAQAAERQQRQAELAEMRAELSRAHSELRKASREVARMHRELERSSRPAIAPSFSFNLGDKAVIGVILGDNTGLGVEVLGVSPDGPADRAGIQQGDVIIGMMGEPLSPGGSSNSREVLGEVMDEVKPGDEIEITVQRDGSEQDFTVTAETREPFSWQSIVRLPSVPVAPGAPGAPDVTTIIERIEVPEIDEEALRARVESIREGLDRAVVVIDSEHSITHADAPEAWEYRFETLSDIGDGALRQADVWFGLPVTRGLKLAEVDSGLGEYFDAERGVLVLKARDDNDLQLQAGDVILAVGDKEVNKPSDVMRALRYWEPGESIEIRIMRNHSDQVLEVIRPESSVGFDFVPFDDEFEVTVHTSDH